MSKIQELPLLEDEEEPEPRLRVYECPWCHDRTEMMVPATYIYCPNCKKWYAAYRQEV